MRNNVVRSLLCCCLGVAYVVNEMIMMLSGQVATTTTELDLTDYARSHRVILDIMTKMLIMYFVKCIRGQMHATWRF